MAGHGYYCDGISRRSALRIGGSGFLGGITLPGLLQMQAEAATGKPRKAESIIFLYMEGGPSTIDMWDMKPEAPREIRGPYKQIKTNVPGLEICEHLPNCAKIADKYTILRSHSHNDNGHNTGYHYVMTGQRADFADGTNSRIPVNVLYPSLGSIVARELGPRSSVPVYVNVPNPMQAGGPGFFGADHGPFVIETDPVQPDFEVKDLRAPGLRGGQAERRKRLLSALDKKQPTAKGRAAAMTTYYEKAHDLVTSAAAQKARKRIIRL